jgi:Na+-translocating ferredoxin:NAD+ oxidoreductase RnfD subunit
VNRWIIPLAFIGSYLLLQYLLIVNYDPVILFEDIYHRLYSVTFVLFIYFMLTDPPVTPSKWYEQIGFAFAVALMATLLDRFHGYRVQHLFMAVFFFSIFVNLLKVERDYIALLKLTAIILFFVIATLTFIEMQVPYYFEMEG